MHNLALLPILIPAASASLALLIGKSLKFQRIISLVGTLAYLASAIVLLATVYADGIQVVHVGNWVAPFGIAIVADLFNCILLVVSATLALAIVIYSLGSIDTKRELFGYHPLFHFLLMGVSGSFLTGDMFNLYVWFEVMLMASFVLLALGGERPQLEGAIKYVTINLISSAIFLAAVGTLYGATGTLNMADLHIQLKTSVDPQLVTVIASLFLICFGIKAALFPLFFWLPASYHTAPLAVSALFAGLLTKVGVYALFRVFTLLFADHFELTSGVMLSIASFTMVTGVLGAAVQPEFRRTLSFHIVSQIGYMLLGLALFTPLAIAGAIYFIAHNMIVKANLFLVSGVVYRLQGTYQYKRLGGIYKSSPWLSAMFIVSALSLAGAPPFSGFWGKLMIIRAGLEIDAYISVTVALAVSLLTLFSMTKIWGEVFWKDLPDGDPAEQTKLPDTAVKNSLVTLIPIACLTACTIVMGLLAEPLFTLCLRASDQLLNPVAYVTAVLGEGPY
jgi:multicomponent Na+:H+ antiporter subunit D